MRPRTPCWPATVRTTRPLRLIVAVETVDPGMKPRARRFPSVHTHPCTSIRWSDRSVCHSARSDIARATTYGGGGTHGAASVPCNAHIAVVVRCIFLCDPIALTETVCYHDGKAKLPPSPPLTAPSCTTLPLPGRFLERVDVQHTERALSGRQEHRGTLTGELKPGTRRHITNTRSERPDQAVRLGLN